MEEASAEVINFGQFTNSNNVTEAKLGETFGQWLDGRAVFAVQTKGGSSGTVVIGGPMNAL